MFAGQITRTSFVDEVSNGIFTNITANNGFEGDVSFLSTLRALLGNRISKEHEVILKINTSSYSEKTLRDCSSVDSVMNSLFGIDKTRTRYEDSNNSILVIHSLRNSEEENKKVLEYFKKTLSSVHKGYKKIEDLSLYFKKLMNVDFYINEETNITIVIVDRLDSRRIHAIQAVTSRLLPWFFNDENKLTEEDRNLLLSLTEKTSDKYRKLIENYTQKYNFREEHIKAYLDGFEKVAENCKLRRVEQDISYVEKDIKNYIEMHSELLRKKDDLLVQKLGLMQKLKNKSENEIMDYFIHNKNLHLQYASGSTIDFIVETYIEEYDIDTFERYINNKDSVFYEFTNDIFGYDECEMFFKALFGENACLKLKTCAAYSMNLESFNVSGLQEYDYPAKFDNHIPNPHIEEYGCIGDNHQYISTCLSNGNYIAAIEQCAYSARNFNMSDIVVAEAFISWILDSSATSIIELPDGTSCTPREALKWLEEREK